MRLTHAIVAVLTGCAVAAAAAPARAGSGMVGGSIGMLTPGDAADIRNVLGSYAQDWDNFQLDDFAALFTPDGRVDFGGAVVNGRAEIRAFHEKMVGNFRRLGIQRRHLLGSIVIHGKDAHHAAVELYGQVFSTEKDRDGTQVMPPVQYRGTLVKTQEGWKIADWTAHPDKPFPSVPQK